MWIGLSKKKKIYKYFEMYVFLMIWTLGGLGCDNLSVPGEVIYHNHDVSLSTKRLGYGWTNEIQMQ